jgi:hypothetical protein
MCLAWFAIENSRQFVQFVSRPIPNRVEKFLDIRLRPTSARQVHLHFIPVFVRLQRGKPARQAKHKSGVRGRGRPVKTGPGRPRKQNKHRGGRGRAPPFKAATCRRSPQRRESSQRDNWKGSAGVPPAVSGVAPDSLRRATTCGVATNPIRDSVRRDA